MSKTVRRKPWYPKVKGFFGKKVHRDASCSPQCTVCGKNDDYLRGLKRRDKRAAMEQELRDSA